MLSYLIHVAMIGAGKGLKPRMCGILCDLFKKNKNITVNFPPNILSFKKKTCSDNLFSVCAIHSQYILYNYPSLPSFYYYSMEQ